MKFIGKARKRLSDSREKGLSLEFRFFTTFFAVLLTIFLGVTILLFSFGIFDINKSKTAALVDHELTSISNRIKSEFATISSHSVNLSETIAYEIKQKLTELDISPQEISNNPSSLTPILESVYPTITAELKALKASGSYVILDATVNPSLQNAEYSKSCLYIRNISAQNNFFTSHYDLRLVCGPMEIAQKRGIDILPQWHLEMNSKDLSFFQMPIEAAKENQNISSSQLFYWTGKVFDGYSDYASYCSCPIIINNTIVGVCGYEVNTSQFKLAYTPNIEGQDYSFCMLVPSQDNKLIFERSLFSGNYTVTSQQPKKTIDIPTGKGFNEYETDAGNFLGKQKEISLYSSVSPFADETYYVVILTPKSQIEKVSFQTNLRLIILLSVLFILCVLLSLFLCKKNVTPIKNAFAEIKKNRKAPKTRIKEIDDLFEYLEEIDKEHRRLKNEQNINDEYNPNDIDPVLYNSFVENLETLTEREKEIFQLYINGLKAKDIEDQLKITTNTMKYHNKNIYNKLNVSSRKELVLYALHMNNMNKREK